MGVFLVAYPALCLSYLLRHWGDLDTPARRAKAERMYQDVSLRRGRRAVLYYPVFIVRRLVFVLIPLLLKAHPYLQLQLLVFLSSLYVIWYTSIWPHATRRLVRQEIFNEALFMALNYHMFTFTAFVQHVEAQFTMGYSYLAAVSFLIIVNLALAVQNTVRKISSKRRMAQLRAAMIAKMAEEREEYKKNKVQRKVQRRRQSEEAREQLRRKDGLKTLKGKLPKEEAVAVDSAIDDLIGTLKPQVARRKRTVIGALSVIEEDENEFLEDREMAVVQTHREKFNKYFDKQVE